MKLTVVGDSFCSAAHGWPQQLADMLNLELDCFGLGGGAWWTVRNYLQQKPDKAMSSKVIVFVHTNADRIPTLNSELVSFNHSEPAVDEPQTAVKLYYKYIHDPEFMLWAQNAWFEEIASTYTHSLVVHLHSFPWTCNMPKSGINVTTALSALSLNELGRTQFDLFADSRLNHFNTTNNQALAQQLAEIIANEKSRCCCLDHTRFEQRTLTWLDWK